MTTSGTFSPAGRWIACSRRVTDRTCAIDCTLAPNSSTPAASPGAMRLRRLSGISVPPNANTTRCPASGIELRDGSGGGGASASKLAQHVVQDPAVAEVQRLLGRVDPHAAGELLVARPDGHLARR